MSVSESLSESQPDSTSLPIFQLIAILDLDCDSDLDSDSDTDPQRPPGGRMNPGA
jgi:hypothetical protein